MRFLTGRRRRGAPDKKEQDADLAAAYSAARAAGAGDEEAVRATAHAIVAARRLRPADAAARRRALVAQAILVALRERPAEPWGGIPHAEREPLALACVGKLSVEEIASALGLTGAEVRRRLLTGLRGIRSSQDPRGQRRGFGPVAHAQLL